MSDTSQELAFQKATWISQPIQQIHGWLILFVGVVPPFLFMGLLRLHRTSDLTRYLIGFGAGIGFAAVARHAFNKLLSGNLFSEPDVHTGDSKLYNLKHGVLNINVGETSMWMNMGYWKGQAAPTNFQHACRSLLQEILFTARLCSNPVGDAEETALRSSSTDPTVNIIDIGFGCGDQAIALQKLCNLGSYIGLTIDRRQFALAEQRLRRPGFLTDVSDMSARDSVTVRRIFHADAAKPDVWAEELKRAIAGSFLTSETNHHKKNWILALDVLYHLAPSRLPLFRHACHNLRASIMAFDLLLPDPQERQATRLQTYMLRLVSLLTSTPYSNFLTPAQYRASLVSAGYPEDEIEIHDISDHVFGPLVEFLTWQDRQLKTFGLSIGAFHAARWVFGWWAQTGVVRGCIVVARVREGMTQS